MTDISKEAVERLAALFEKGAETSCYRSNLEYRLIAATLRAQAARIEQLEAKLATARNDALKEAAGVAYAACADTRHVKMGLSVEKNILALMTKEPNT